MKTHGGKYYLSEFVISHFPVRYEDMVFVEMFAGGASVLLNKKPSRLDILNDIDQNMVNLFRIIRDEPTKLVSTLRQIRYCEPMFLKFKTLLEESDGSDPFSDAVWEYSLRRMSRGGMRKAFAWSERKRGGKPGDQNAWETMIPHLPLISEKLQGVLVHSGDFQNIMEIYNDKNVLMYLDPPYLPSTRKSTKVYVNEMSKKQHESMLKLVNQSRSKIIISGYSSEMYEESLKGWHRYTKDIANHSSQSATKSRKTEVLWANYPPG